MGMILNRALGVIFAMMVTLARQGATRERGGIGIHSGLKIRHLRVCGFESHRSYQF